MAGFVHLHCHSVWSLLDGTIPFPTPVVLGHEGAGVVEEVGNAVRKVKVGDESGTAAKEAKSGKTARASVGSQAARRFAFPLLTDVVAESCSTNGNSSGADERR